MYSSATEGRAVCISCNPHPLPLGSRLCKPTADTHSYSTPLLEAIIETQNGHTGKLDAIIATQAEQTAFLNQHSIELELIKGYLG